MPFGGFCVVVGLCWWWAFRKFGLVVKVDGEGIRFNRGRTFALARWAALAAVEFSASGVSITANGRTWRVDSALSGWHQFERLLRDRASAEVLAAWLIPPFRVRTKWRDFIQPGIFCAACIAGGINRLESGQRRSGLVVLGVGGLFLFLLRGAVLWFRFEEEALVLQRLLGRERYRWDGLQFATVKDKVLAMSFSDGGLVAIHAKQITRSLEEIFLSMQDFWAKVLPREGRAARARPIWRWPVATFWWAIVPALMLITFPAVIGSIRNKLGIWVSVCDGTPTPEGLCQTLHNVRALLRLDIAVLVGTFLAVAGIYWAGEYCNRHRDKLLTLFRPIFVVTLACTILMLIGQSALLAALLYYVPLEMANIRLSGLLIVVGIALVLGLYQIARNTWSAVRPAPLEADALSVQPIEQPGIWALASSVAQSLGVPTPDNILLGLELEYFLTESPMRVGGVKATGYSLYISIPATRLMTEGELRAVIGHEFGHFRGTDTAFTRRFLPLYNAAARALEGIGNAHGSWSLLPAIYMLHLFLVSFGKVESALSRDREFLADNAGAEAGSPIDLASALVKLELFAPTVSKLVQERVYRDQIVTSIGEQVDFTWPSLIPASLLKGQTPHPLDSHPALGSRLENLRVRLDAVLAKPLANGAVQVFEKPGDLERRVLGDMRRRTDASSLSRKFTFVPIVPPTSGR